MVPNKLVILSIPQIIANMGIYRININYKVIVFGFCTHRIYRCGTCYPGTIAPDMVRVGITAR